MALLESSSHLRLNWCGIGALTDETLKCLKHCAKRCAWNMYQKHVTNAKGFNLLVYLIPADNFPKTNQRSMTSCFSPVAKMTLKHSHRKWKSPALILLKLNKFMIITHNIRNTWGFISPLQSIYLADLISCPLFRSSDVFACSLISTNNLWLWLFLNTVVIKLE